MAGRLTSRAADTGTRAGWKLMAPSSRSLLAEQGDITLVEIQARLTERGVPVGIGTVHRFFARHGITREKR